MTHHDGGTATQCVSRQQLHKLANEANTALNAAADTAGLSAEVARHPYGALAAALGIGYILGGGLFTVTTIRLLRLGIKVAALPFLRDRLFNAAEVIVKGFVFQTNREPEGSQVKE